MSIHVNAQGDHIKGKGKDSLNKVADNIASSELLKQRKIEGDYE